MKEPFYHLDYTSGECLFRIYLNEILILDNIDGQISLAGNLLLNNFIYKAGEQNLLIEILPKKNESLLNKDSFVEVYLYASDQSTGFKEKIDIIGKGTRLPKELLLSDNKIAKPPVNWHINFNTNVPYNLIPFWQQGILLNKNKDFENRIKAFYLQIYQLAKEGIYFEPSIGFGGMVVIVTAKASVWKMGVGFEDKPYELIKPEPDLLKDRFYIIKANNGKK